MEDTTSPKMTLDDAKSAAAAGLFPKVTQESIEARIARQTYYYHHALADGVLTICVLEMTNGFMVQGVSAAADPRNHNIEIGKRYAYENAFKQLWQLEGYLLREKISLGGTMVDPV